ncbi:c-type cytochrome biogenesis protein CcmI [Photorhabdus viridis]|uniref:c-type cytochrome biogenesis protein CcmI n=1 Tax=Photorhabdus viridis TaxID=3163327 RepID=UPI0033071FF8
MKLVVLLLIGIFTHSAWATIDTYPFKSVEQEQQFYELTKQLRCPKCQNNNIADSNSIIAEGMRTKVYELTIQGKSKQHIIDYMVERYGNFVTYKPPVTPVTLILWGSPLLFVLNTNSSRDALNKILYQKRLNELEQNEGQDVVHDRSKLIQELQRNLLSDIPIQPTVQTKPINRWALVPGVLVLIIVAVGFYLKTGNLTQVLDWQKQEKHAKTINQQAHQSYLNKL